MTTAAPQRETNPLHELDVDECLQLLGREGIGRLALNDAAGPVIVPVNYLFHGGVVHIRTAPGTKLAVADQGGPAAFEVDSIDPVLARGWSVLVRGRLKRLMWPAPPGNPAEPEPYPAGEHDQLIGLLPTAITGRRLGPPTQTLRRPLPDSGIGHVWHGTDGDDLLG